MNDISILKKSGYAATPRGPPPVYGRERTESISALVHNLSNGIRLIIIIIFTLMMMGNLIGLIVGLICAKCFGDIKVEDQVTVGYNHYHLQCLACHKCKRSILPLFFLF